jgi:hypothetical protein
VRLGGWARIGIVLSVVWMIGGGLWGNSIGIDALGANVVAVHRRCLEQRSIQPDGSIPKDTDWGPCSAAFMRDYPPAVAGHWWYAAAFAFIPIPIAWLIVYGLAALVRWIRAGFRLTQGAK